MVTEDLSITTDRLVLRLFTPDDVDDMYAYQGLDEVARYLYRPPRTRERCAEVIGEIGVPPAWEKDGDSLTLAVCRREEPGVIGEVVLKLESHYARQAEIGWVLNPAWEGRGYATEAAREMRRLAFERFGVHRLFARIDTANTASERLCERLGMRREAHLLENDWTHGDWGSEYVYALLAREAEQADRAAEAGGDRAGQRTAPAG
ncbi:GNAT family N-acetyltransferase [Streptomyces nanshensis]|uniref:Acetyltransferase n=1 Tax=Streptomyces nanshensis TaxID=518642 RepID=A0A1E7L541_9ACTN|nr:GNAT family N-acetyltransferase [Streptomyces nanshensis]OEV11241.1 acetyltransferase [Streptomyces nanshensis]